MAVFTNPFARQPTRLVMMPSRPNPDAEVKAIAMTALAIGQDCLRLQNSLTMLKETPAAALEPLFIAADQAARILAGLFELELGAPTSTTLVFAILERANILSGLAGRCQAESRAHGQADLAYATQALRCPTCSGVFRSRAAYQTVACPHCSQHLDIRLSAPGAVDFLAVLDQASACLRAAMPAAIRSADPYSSFVF